MTKIATIDWFGRYGTSVFSENTAIFTIRNFGIPEIVVILEIVVMLYVINFWRDFIVFHEEEMFGTTDETRFS